MTTRRRQLLRLATSDQACEELLLTEADSGDSSGTNQRNAWQRLTELEHRIRQQEPTNSEVINNNNKPPQSLTQTPLCSICHQADRQYLIWHLPPESVRRSPQVGPTTSEWAGAVTRAAEAGSPVLQSLFDELQNDGSLAFDQSNSTSWLLADVASFLSELVSSKLSAELPAVFDNASVTLVGGWSQETALASEFPVLDFVINLPGWARTSRLCLCQVAPGRANGVAVRLRQAGSQPIEASAAHRACASAIEAAVLQRARDLLRQHRGGSSSSSRRHHRLSASHDLGWWRQAGRDWPPEAAQPKRLRLNLNWRAGEGDSAGRLCGVNVWFGVPVLMLVAGSTGAELRGHLLLGAGEPRLLRLALEERRWSLSRSLGCNDPVPLLCRAAKFVLKLGEYLAEDVSMTGEHRRRQGLSFSVNTSVRELMLRYGDSGVREEAFATGANLQDRLLDLLRALLSSRLGLVGPAVFTESLRLGLGPPLSSSSTTLSCATSMSESTVSIIRYLERASELPQSTENLLPTMLQYFRLKNQPDSLLKGDEDDRLLGLATQISFDLLTLSD